MWTLCITKCLLFQLRQGCLTEALVLASPSISLYWDQLLKETLSLYTTVQT